MKKSKEAEIELLSLNTLELTQEYIVFEEECNMGANEDDVAEIIGIDSEVDEYLSHLN